MIDKYFSDIDFLVAGYGRSSQYMVAIHREFYEWASDRVGGVNVLEAGCGEGYGAEILAQSAAYLVAIDTKPELIEHARRRYAAPNLSFQIMNCEELTFQGGSFDAVVCNELLEHLPRPELFLSEARRVLKPGGKFLCATTNSSISFTNEDGTPMNRNHYREFNRREFLEELESYFRDVRVRSQIMNEDFRDYTMNRRARVIERLMVRLGFKHKIPIRLRNRIRQWLTGVNADSAAMGGFPIVDEAHDDALYLVGTGVKPGRLDPLPPDEP